MHENEHLPLDERRRRIFEGAIAKFAALGTPIDTDPRFLELVEKWIDGDLGMVEVARSYAEIRKATPREVSPNPSAVQPIPSHRHEQSQEELLVELEHVIGIYDQS